MTTRLSSRSDPPQARSTICPHSQDSVHSAPQTWHSPPSRLKMRRRIADHDSAVCRFVSVSARAALLDLILRTAESQSQPCLMTSWVTASSSSGRGRPASVSRQSSQIDRALSAAYCVRYHSNGDRQTRHHPRTQGEPVSLGGTCPAP